MKTILLIISLVCFAICSIQNLIKSYKWYKKYLIDIFEYNKGRGYFNVWQNDLHKCYTHLTWAIAFFCSAILIFKAL